MTRGDDMDRQDEEKMKSAKSLERQIGAVLLSILASVLVIITLQGTRERLISPIPGKSYKYVDRLPLVTGVLFALTSAFYLFDSVRQCRESPGQRQLQLLLAANLFALIASAVKFELICERKPNETAQQEADQSTELE